MGFWGNLLDKLLGSNQGAGSGVPSGASGGMYGGQMTIGADQTSPMAGDTFGVGAQQPTYRPPPAPMPVGTGSPAAPATDPAAANPTPGQLPAGGGAPLAQQPGSFWQTLLKGLQDPTVATFAGRILGTVGEGMADRRRERIEDEDDNLRKLQTSDYLASGGRPYTPPAGAPSYGFGPTSTSARVQATADRMQDELIKRMNQPTTPSFAEQLLQYAGPALAVYGQAQGARQAPPSKPKP